MMTVEIKKAIEEKMVKESQLTEYQNMLLIESMMLTDSLMNDALTDSEFAEIKNRRNNLVDSEKVVFKALLECGNEIEKLYDLAEIF